MCNIQLLSAIVQHTCSNHFYPIQFTKIVQSLVKRRMASVRRLDLVGLKLVNTKVLNTIKTLPEMNLFHKKEDE